MLDLLPTEAEDEVTEDGDGDGEVELSAMIVRRLPAPQYSYWLPPHWK